jgi:hypothetical protein
LHVKGPQVIGLPPAVSLTVPYEFGEVITLGLVGHLVEIAQVADVTQCPGAEAGLHAADLARRAEQAFRDLLDR